MMPFINLRAAHDARFDRQRAAFLNRHRRLCWPAVTLVVGFAAGVLVMLIATR